MAEFELADDFLPIYDVSDAVATVADADRETARRPLLEVDLLKLGREVPVVGMLGEAAGVDAAAVRPPGRAAQPCGAGSRSDASEQSGMSTG